MSETKKIEILTDVLGNSYSSGQERLFYCKKCQHHKKKLSVNLSKNKFKCWVCDFAGPISRLIKRYGNYSHLQQWNELIGIVEINDYETIFLNNQELEEKQATIKLPEEFQSLCNRDISLTSLKARRYLKERGVSKEDILFWKIGYATQGEYEGRIIIPSFNSEGKVNYYVGRSYEDSWKKYLNPEAKKDIIFNELNVDWSSDVTIVEGVFDAIKAKNAIPILGSTMRENSTIFREIVRNDPAVYIALDPDAEKKAEKLIKDLLSYDVEVYKIPIPEEKDIGDMSHKQFLECKSKARLIKDTDYFLINKIMSI